MRTAGIAARRAESEKLRNEMDLLIKELDFDRLPSEKQRIYRQIQAAHIHASPDGPWFFIIARSLAETGEFQLMGITDTAMLRPQVFALQEGVGTPAWAASRSSQGSPSASSRSPTARGRTRRGRSTSCSERPLSCCTSPCMKISA